MIAESSSSEKKTSHFPCQLKEDLEALFKRAKNPFGSEIEWRNIETFKLIFAEN